MSKTSRMYGVEIGQLVDVRAEVTGIHGEMATVEIFYNLAKPPLTVVVPIAAMEPVEATAQEEDG